MDAELVAGSAFEREKGGDPPSPVRYGKQFEDLCGYYMALGMSYQDYWDGDNQMPRFYRDKFKADTEIVNYRLWLLGLYVYEAVLDTAPAMNPLMKDHKPVLYRSSPFPLTSSDKEKFDEMDRKRKLEKTKIDLQTWAMSVNKRMTEVKNGG